MGLFGGGNSSSSTSTTSNQEIQTVSPDTSGVNTDSTILAGYNNTYTTNFDKTIADSFNKLADLSHSALDSATQSADRALTAVTSNQQALQTPENSLVKSLIPLLSITAVGIIIVMIFKGRK